MNRKTVWMLILLTFASVHPAEAQQPKVYRIGVLVPGGPWYAIVNGLRAGLTELGLQEGKQYVLVIRETKGDAKTAEDAARGLEKEKVNLIYTTATSVTLPAKRATTEIPIVFCAGADLVNLGLVENFAHPGGRLTGVYDLSTDLTAKRLEILKEIVPKLRRVVTYYNPHNPVAVNSSRLAREAAQLQNVELLEQNVASVEELQTAMQTLRAGEVDAYFQVSDPLVLLYGQLITDTAKTKRLPTMFLEESFTVEGGLASYGVSFHETGRLSAKYVQRILSGINARDLPVEGVNKINFFINLKTAKQIGLTIPPNVLARADKVIR